MRFRSGLTVLFLASMVLQPPAAMATDRVQGEVTTFRSDSGLEERCVRIAHVPNGVYSRGDEKTEADFCRIDLYDRDLALCPKIWSTSPSTILYDISSGPYRHKRTAFQEEACGVGKLAKLLAKDNIAKFKISIGQEGTSATFSTASLLYYHFSRYFQTGIQVPVAVWRSMDAAAHLNQVAYGGLALSGNPCEIPLLNKGWQVVVGAEEDPAAYYKPADLFTSDLTQIYGVLLETPGKLYGPEFFGLDPEGWGESAARTFQTTPAFTALRTDAALETAIAQGLAAGRGTPAIAQALGQTATGYQMLFWMKDLTEITLMDYIFAQQDRIGNIDFVPYYVWTYNGQLMFEKASKHQPGDNTVPLNAVLVRRSALNDNDAGGREEYDNFTKITGMLDHIRHYNAGLYARLMALDADFQQQGPIHAWLGESLGLKEGQVQQIVTNTATAAEILRKSCAAGQLRFDLKPEQYLENGRVTPDAMSCLAR